jgi:glycosyltransferase involved in cell wall biosynthesis
VLFCRDEVIAELVREAGVPAEVGRLGGHASLHHARRFADQLRRQRPDALLLGTFKKTWLGAMAGRRAGVPRVVARIGLATDLPGRSVFYRVAFGHWIDRVVVSAADLAAPVRASMSSSAARRVVVIHNGVDEPSRSLPPGGLRRELGIPPAAPVAGAVARLVGQKRLDLLLRAVARIEGVRCLIAGDGPERTALARLAVELGIGDRVTLLGHRGAVGDVLDALDVFVVTSRVEGMSNAMLEALVAGVPVVSTPVSGATEALEPLADGGRPGLIVEPAENAVAARVSEVLADPAARARMSAAARVRARERFAWDDKLALWEEVLAGRDERRD